MGSKKEEEEEKEKEKMETKETKSKETVIFDCIELLQHRTHFITTSREETDQTSVHCSVLVTKHSVRSKGDTLSKTK